MLWLQHYNPQSHLTTHMLEGQLNLLNRNLKILHAFIQYFVLWGLLLRFRGEDMSIFDWGILKREVP